jgi:hypothetical protein
LIKVLARLQNFRQQIDLMIFDEPKVTREGDMRRVATSIVFETMDPDALYSPSLQLDSTAAQKLMDELWDCGLRPSEGSGSAGALAATQYHLEDLRTLIKELIFKKS